MICQNPPLVVVAILNVESPPGSANIVFGVPGEKEGEMDGLMLGLLEGEMLGEREGELLGLSEGLREADGL